VHAVVLAESAWSVAPHEEGARSDRNPR
jgi:hypothetical protein